MARRELTPSRTAGSPVAFAPNTPASKQKLSLNAYFYVLENIQLLLYIMFLEKFSFITSLILHLNLILLFSMAVCKLLKIINRVLFIACLKEI